jgi:hypothetical protein
VRRFLMAVLLGTLAVAIGCGGGSGSTSSTTQTIATPTQNVQPLIVDGGSTAFQQASGSIYVNGPFVTLTVCAPGSTTNCNTIDHVLLDTGSYGLRLLSFTSGGELTTAVQSALPATSVSGNPSGECVQFVDMTFLWGPVATADVKVAGEVASSVPVHVVGEGSAFSTVPASCGLAGSTDDDDSLVGLGANGILGVGPFPQDCGPACVTTEPTGVGAIYYSCPSTGCVPSTIPLAQQVQNPVSLFAADNNGVIVEFPAASGPEPTLSGSLVFGIGTQSNNGLGSATVLGINSSGNFTTNFNGSTMPDSFLDSGSNSLDFDDNSIPGCQVNTFFDCPATPTNLSAMNLGANGATSTVSFSVINADNAFNSFPTAGVVPGLAGPSDGSFTSFDFGLPFFYGKNVFTSIAGKTAPGGTPPYWAY